MEVREVVRLRVVEKAAYVIELDPETLDEHIPEELLDSPEDLRDWLSENEDIWLGRVNEDNYSECIDRTITEVRVVPVVPKREDNA